MYYNNTIDYMKCLKDKKLIIFGAGKMGSALARKLKAKGFRIIGFIDNDANKKGKTVEGCEVIGNLNDAKGIIADSTVIIPGGGHYTV